MTDYAFFTGYSADIGFSGGLAVDVWDLTSITRVGQATAPLFSGVLQSPGALRINHAGTKLYVTNGVPGSSTAGLLGVFDLPSLTWNTWIDLSAYCTGAAGIVIDASDTYAYVTGYTSGSVTQVDLASNTIVGNCATGVIGGGFTGVTIDAAGVNAYVVDPGGGNIVQIDTSTMTVVTSVSFFGLGNGTAIDIEPAGGNLWASGFLQITLPLTGASNFYSGPATESLYPGAVKVNHAGTKTYLITDYTSSQFWAIDLSTFAVTGPITLPGTSGVGFNFGPTDIAVTPSDGRAIVSLNFAAYQFSVIDATTYAVTNYPSPQTGQSYFGADIGNYSPSAPTNQIVMML